MANKNGRTHWLGRPCLSKIALAKRDYALAVLAPLVFNAFCAILTNSENAGASVAARSAIILRSRATFAAFRPSINRLYVTPAERAAALIRICQRARKFRFLVLRSRK